MKVKRIKTALHDTFSSRILAITSEVLAALMGIALIVVQVICFQNWSKSVAMIDYDIYLVLTGLASVIVLGMVVFTRKRTVRKLGYMLWISAFITLAQFIVGLVHSILIYATYRLTLLVRCFHRSAPDSWNIFGISRTEAVQACHRDFKRFFLFNLLTCFGFSILMTVCLYLVYRYYRRLKIREKSNLAKLVQPSDEHMISPSEENPLDNESGYDTYDPTTHLGQYSPRMPAESREEAEHLIDESRDQRQRLYDEIAKRKQLERLFHDPSRPRRSLMFLSPAKRYSLLSTHQSMDDLPTTTAHPYYDTREYPASTDDLHTHHDAMAMPYQRPRSSTDPPRPCYSVLLDEARYKDWAVPNDTQTAEYTSRPVDATDDEPQRLHHHQRTPSGVSQRSSRYHFFPAQDHDTSPPSSVVATKSIVSPIPSEHINPLDEMPGSFIQSPESTYMETTSFQPQDRAWELANPSLSHTPVADSPAMDHHDPDERTPLNPFEQND
ncbi:hypothetical protein DM01DRAFT_324164 [Hesseltinella vesiculosa]|uniref:Uncharacterized protein n=1 Tax=Hesseltinella vesiculosa TaxID=101127 RepID=A0A1X2GWK2_9FUNG|nr:hypothetical protein DM01DRAFT_324164 [Hesseltinella vesiculosa]